MSTRTRPALALGAVLLGALAAGASPAAAQQRRPLFEWRGSVDREVRLVLRGRDLSPQFVGGSERPSSDRARVAAPLPARDGRVYVEVENGRGQVDVVQQPEARNDYTAVVRLRDPSPGSDRYRVVAYWQGDDRWGGRGDGRWDGRGDGRRDDDDRWDDRRGGRGNGRWDDDRDRDGRGGRGDGGWGNGGWGNGNGGWGGAEHGTLRWSGRVDDALLLQVQGGRVQAVTLSGRAPVDVRTQVTGRGIPARDGVDVRIRRAEGRGRVELVEQPSARNGYTAVVRIRDPQSGTGVYDLDLSW